MKAKHDAVTPTRGSDDEIDLAIEELIALRKGSRLDGVSWKALRDVGRR